jgi:hypothetical protein
MTQSLFPVIRMPAVQGQIAAPTPVEYLGDFQWNFDRNDFDLDPTGAPLVISGAGAWQQACRLALLSERHAYLAMPGWWGVELEVIPSVENRPLAETRLIATITDTLMVFPQTVGVDLFSFEWSGDQVTVTCRVTSTLDEQFVVRIPLP